MTGQPLQGICQIFVSHSSEDADLCKRITGLLEDAGLQVWIAPRNIRAGESYGEQIMLGLESSQFVLLVLSEAANQSKFVAREIERAVSLGKVVIPLRIQDVQPNKSMALFVSSAHWVDAIGQPLDAAVHEVVQSVRAAQQVPGDVGATPQRQGWMAQARRHVRKAKGWVVAVAGAGAVLSGLVGYYTTYKTVASGTSAVTLPTAATSEINPLSIAVLPFANLTGDTSQTFVADGLTASVTSDLVRIRDALVINATTAAAFKDKGSDLQQLGTTLGVRFILQGSVQRNGTKIRIHAQLADTRSNVQLWTESFDGDASDLFALQDQVTTRIGNSIGREMVIVSARDSEKSKGSVKVNDLILRARAMQLSPRTLSWFENVERIYGEVLTLDSSNVNALAGLGNTMIFRASYFGHTLDAQSLKKYYEEGLKFVAQAKLLDPDFSVPYIGLALYAEAHGDYAAQLAAAKKVKELSPKDQRSANLMAHTLLMGGDAKQGLVAIHDAMGLDPRHPIDQVLFNTGWAYFMLGDYDASIAWYQKTIEANPTYIDAYGWIAMAYAMKGDDARAREFTAKLKQADPKGSFVTRRRPLSAGPAAYQDFYDKKYLPAAKKAGII